MSIASIEMVVGQYPKLEGITTNFFQYFWYIIFKEVHEVVEESRTLGKILHAFNSTFLTLVPNDHKESTINNFKPISTCNVIYKTITKFISN